jgi:hypothetical protein
MPIRLQLSRRKGFDLQALSMATNGLPAVNVARPSRWGNPFTMKRAIEAGFIRSPDEPLANLFLVDVFSDWLAERGCWWQSSKSDQRRADFLRFIPELRGKNLACWCKPGEPCHADILIEIANAHTPTGEG